MIEEDIPETHKCGQCSREFVTKQALQKHVSDHANEKRKEQQTEKKPTFIIWHPPFSSHTIIINCEFDSNL